MKPWEHEVYKEEFDSWAPYADEEEGDKHWNKVCDNEIEFTREQWINAKDHLDHHLFISAYNEEAGDHVGPIHLTINMNDAFFYAGAYSTVIPQERLDDVLSILNSKRSDGDKCLILDAIAADIDGIPPIMEIVEEMEKCPYIPKKKAAYYRQQHKDQGTEHYRW